MSPMVSYISEGVKISVETFYQTDYSNPLQSEFMFGYKVTIDNMNSFPIIVLGRRWHIFDSDGSYREVEGEGIVGMQPCIHPGQSYEYVSGCNLHTPIGKMNGEYIVKSTYSNNQFIVKIPTFEFYYPAIFN